MGGKSRKEQRAELAATLRDDGCTWEDVAQELRRCEACSPLLALRWAHNLSQQGVADAYDALLTADSNDKPIDYRRVHRWEQWPDGGTTPPLACLNRLAEVFQVRASFLFSGGDYRHLDGAYQPDPDGEPIRGELLPLAPRLPPSPAPLVSARPSSRARGPRRSCAPTTSPRSTPVPPAGSSTGSARRRT